MEKHRLILSTISSLLYGDKVNNYKSVHHSSPTRENRKHTDNFQNKSESSVFTAECPGIFSFWPN